MAAKNSPSSETRPGFQKDDPAGIASNGVDALVSDFLAELNTFSSEKKHVQQPVSTGEIPADKVVPITDRKDAQSKTLSDFSAAQKRPDAAGLQRTSVRNNSSASFTTAKNALKVPEPLKTGTAPPRSIRWRKGIISALAAVILLGILGFFFFLRPDKASSVSKPIEPVPKAAANKSNEVAARSEDLWYKSMVSSPASDATKGSSIQPTRPIGTSPRVRIKGKSSLITAAKADSGSRISEPDLISKNPRERSVGVAEGSPEAKPGVQERPPGQTTDTGAGAGLPPLAPSSSTIAPAVEDAASQLSPNPIAPNTPAITIPGNASTAQSGPSTREPSRAPADAGPTRNADSGSVSAESTRTGARVMVPVMAQPITKVQPTYPLMARRLKVTGIVELEAEVNEKGDVIRAKTVSGPGELRSAAEEALMKWKFKPASINGVNVRGTTRVSVAFTIK